MDRFVVFLCIFWVLPFFAYLFLRIRVMVKNILLLHEDYSNSLKISRFSIAEILFLFVAPTAGFCLSLLFFESERLAPFSRLQLAVIAGLYYSGAAAFVFSKYVKRRYQPVHYLVINSGLLLGLLVSLDICIHLSADLVWGLIIPFLGVPIISPIIAVVVFSAEIFRSYAEQRTVLGPHKTDDKAILLLKLPFWQRNGYLLIFVFILITAIAGAIVLSGIDIHRIIPAFIPRRSIFL